MKRARLSFSLKAFFGGLFLAALLIFGPLGRASSVTSLAKNSCEALLKKALGVSRLVQIYETKKSEVHSPEDFWRVLLEVLDIPLDVVGEMEQIPPRGTPLVVVANHPFGLLDGISLAHLISQRRNDYLILGNALLGQIPEIQDRIVAVHVLKGSKQEKRKTFLLNKEALKKAQAHVQAGGALIAFPSGVVATDGQEGEWQTSVAKVVMESKAASLPVYFEGKNSSLFHLASRLHESVREGLRVALLPRELLNKRGKPLRVVIGQPLPPPSGVSAKDLTETLRSRVKDLSSH